MVSGIFKDLSKLRFGRLTVVKRLPNKNRKVIYECLCDCGNIVIVRADSLFYKKTKGTKSCGCLQKEAAKKNGKLKAIDPVLKIKHDIFSRYKTRAKKYKISFELSFKEFESFLDKPCVYCGRIELNCANHRRELNKYVKYNGIDRIDSTKGYKIDNIVPCCSQCNYAKLDFSIEEFKEWICLVYKNFIKGDCL